eukprot:19928-Heterococcus_DN1.PRE.2
MEQPAKAEKVVFHLTGFGKFNGVADNPTSRLMRELPVYLSQQRKELGEASRVASYTVLEVSTEGASDQLHIILNSGTTAGAGATNGVTVYVHCGVDAKSTCFKLEEYAYNEATFRVPDERNYSPNELPIIAENGPLTHRYRTSLPVAWIYERLCAAGWGNCLQRSDDAGRFVCNYVYYKSLAHCAGYNDKRSLFIHCPPLSAVSEDDQRCFIKDCLIVIADSCVKGVEGPPAEVLPAADADRHRDATVSNLQAMGWDPKTIESVLATDGAAGLDAQYAALLAAGNGHSAYGSNPREDQQLPLPPDEIEQLLSLQAEGMRSRSGSETLEGSTQQQRSRSPSPHAASNSPVYSHGGEFRNPDYSSNSARTTPRSLTGRAPPHHRSRSGNSSLSADSSSGMPQQCKLLLLVRHDLGLSAGQIARQAVQASLRACRVVAEYDPEVMYLYERDGDQTTIAVVEGDELQQVADQANSLGLPLTLLTDAERGAETQLTVAAIGPAPAGVLDELASRLGRLA